MRIAQTYPCHFVGVFFFLSFKCILKLGMLNWLLFDIVCITETTYLQHSIYTCTNTYDTGSVITKCDIVNLVFNLVVICNGGENKSIDIILIEKPTATQWKAIASALENLKIEKSKQQKKTLADKSIKSNPTQLVVFLHTFLSPR